MEVYITKYYKTRGIIEIEIDPDKDTKLVHGNYYIKCKIPDYGWEVLRVNSEIFLTKGLAYRSVRNYLDKKLKKIKKEVDFLDTEVDYMYSLYVKDLLFSGDTED